MAIRGLCLARVQRAAIGPVREGMQLNRFALVGFVLCSLINSARAADEKSDYTLDDFVTSYWCGPPPAFTTLERYQEVKNANFTVAFPILYGQSVEHNKAMLDFCQKLGLKAIVHDSRMVYSIGGAEANKQAVDAIVKDYGSHPALLAYHIADEPVAGAFDGLGEVVAYLKQRDPKHPGYINLMPTWARQIPHPDGNPKLSYLGTPTYVDYVRTFVQKVKPAVLCYDNYGMLKQGDRGDFIENLGTVRKVALEADIPFWNIVLLTQHGDFRVLTESELRYEAMQTLAFGARGLVWFTYWSPQGFDGGTTWTHAMINQDGTRDPHYDMARAINADVLAMGRELKNAKSVAVKQHGGGKGEQVDVGESPVSVEAGKVTIGVFHDAKANKHFSVIANLDYKESTTPRLRIASNTGPVVERFDPSSRAWSPVGAKDEIELKLSPGAAALLRW
jgi:hypothetical protein